MKKVLFSLFAISAITLSAATDDPTHEIDLQAGAGGAMGSVGFVLTPATATYGVLSGGYHYNLGGGLQLGGALEFGLVSTASVVTTLRALVGPTYNIGAIPDAIFIRALAGVLYASAAGTVGNLPAASGAAFALRAELGKRFRIVEHFSYTPSVSYDMISTTPSASFLSINVVSFSALF